MNFDNIDSMLGTNRLIMSVCMPEDANSISAVYEAANMGFVSAVMVGNQDTINSLLKEQAPGYHPTIIHASTPEEAAFKSVELVREGKASAIMKGNISTPVLLKAVLNSETGIKASDTLCHVLAFELNNRLIFFSDGGMIPQPTLKDKIAIINNVKILAHNFGYKIPKIAVLSAYDTIVPDSQSSTDAAILAKMWSRGMFGSDCVIDGPFALDTALFQEVAYSKKVFSEVAGNADIIIAPEIDTGNIVGKSILYYGNTRAGGMIIGAKVPVIMLSRADTTELRINSIKLALAAGNAASNNAKTHFRS